MSCNRRFGFGALILAFAGLLILGHKQAEAQTSCGLIQGQPLYANQLNNCFSNKLDVGTAGSANTWNGLQTFNGGTLFTTPPIINLNVSVPPVILSDSVIQLTGKNTSTARIELNSFGGSAGQTFRRADGVASAPSAVQSGETLGFYGVRGYGATGYSSTDTGSFLARAAQNWTDSAQGTVAVLRATPNGSTTIADTLACQVGCIIGSPTGGDEGAGTLNVASNVLINGASISGATNTANTWSMTQTFTVAPVFTAQSGTRTALGLGAAATQGYATGSWTPTFSAATIGNLSVAYTVQTGHYTCIAGLVYVEFSLSFTPTFTTASGRVQVAGLPYSELNTLGGGTLNAWTSAFNFGSGQLSMILAGTTLLGFDFQSGGSGSNPVTVSATPTTVAQTWTGSIVYQTSAC